MVLTCGKGLELEVLV